MIWPLCPFKFSGGERCQLDLGHETRGQPEHKFEERVTVKGGWATYKLLIETANVAEQPRRCRRKR